MSKVELLITSLISLYEDRNLELLSIFNVEKRDYYKIFKDIKNWKVSLNTEENKFFIVKPTWAGFELDVVYITYVDYYFYIQSISNTKKEKFCRDQDISRYETTLSLYSIPEKENLIYLLSTRKDLFGDNLLLKNNLVNYVF